MRMLQYKLPLMDMGYLVASGEIHHSEEANPNECLPIHFTKLDHSDDYLAKCVIDVVTDNPEFRRSYKAVLLGKCSDYYLYSFEVNPSHIVLNYTHGAIILGPGISHVNLQFDVPHKNGKPNSKYTVSLWCCKEQSCELKQYSARVHEYFGDIHRELHFEQIGERMDYDNRYVVINEYVDP